MLIEETLVQWVDEQHLDLIVTTGGTGVSPTDQTPEATRAVIDREIPGLAEAMRMASLEKTIQAVWARGIAGIRKNCLIINLPGSKKAAGENLQAILPVITSYSIHYTKLYEVLHPIKPGLKLERRPVKRAG